MHIGIPRRICPFQTRQSARIIRSAVLLPLTPTVVTCARCKAFTDLNAGPNSAKVSPRKVAHGTFASSTSPPLGPLHPFEVAPVRGMRYVRPLRNGFAASSAVGSSGSNGAYGSNSSSGCGLLCSQRRARRTRELAGSRKVANLANALHTNAGTVVEAALSRHGRARTPGSSASQPGPARVTHPHHPHRAAMAANASDETRRTRDLAPISSLSTKS